MNRFYNENNQWNISQTTIHNIILIGRSRAGKSTVRKTLIDPMSKSVQLHLYAETKDVDLASLQVDQMSDRPPSAEQSRYNANNRFILNIIDTPGLFEIKKDVDVARDNDQLLMTIRNGLTRIGTSYHYICFCISIIDGIRQEDLETLDNVLHYFGMAKFIEHICIIITRCEMKNEAQQAKLKAELETQLPFVKQLKIGVFFAGCLNNDDWKKGNTTSLRFQISNIMSYREKLLKLFTTPTRPCELKGSETMIPRPSKPIPSAISGQNQTGSADQSRRNLNASNPSISRHTSGAPVAITSREPNCGCDKEVHCKTHCVHRNDDRCVVQ